MMIGMPMSKMMEPRLRSCSGLIPRTASPALSEFSSVQPVTMRKMRTVDHQKDFVVRSFVHSE